MAAGVESYVGMPGEESGGVRGQMIFTGIYCISLEANYNAITGV